MNLKYVNGKEILVNKKNPFDQYFTKRHIAKKLFEKTKSIISQYENIASSFTADICTLYTGENLKEYLGKKTT
jgi:hypothetical protein